MSFDDRMSLLTLPSAPSLDLPPGFGTVILPATDDAFAHARGIASQAGAGTLVWARREDRAEFAIVVEPAVPLRQARATLFMGMNALLQAVAVHCPPERSVSFDWPDGLRFNSGLIGGGRLAWPAGCADEDVPGWLVFGAMVRIALPDDIEPGVAPDAAALQDEGFEGEGPAAIVESFARFFMLQVDIWQSAGMGAIIADYAARLAPQGDSAAITSEGDLRIGSERRTLDEALEATAWLDRTTGAPRL